MGIRITMKKKKLKLTEEQQLQMFAKKIDRLCEREGYALVPTITIGRFGLARSTIRFLLKISKSVLHNRVVRV